MRVLVVEDELKMAGLLLRGFRNDGHAADLARTGEDALWMSAAVEDRIAGLDVGADDYLTKPFSFAELLARLRSIVRRGPVERPTVLEVGDLRLDPATRQVWRGTAEIDLTAKEFALLEAFMRRAGQVVTRDYLLEQAWDVGYDNRSNVVAVYVNYLRDKIDRPFGARALETVRGAGYRLRADGG
jgi:two-component system OmpR family response regulator